MQVNNREILNFIRITVNINIQCCLQLQVFLNLALLWDFKLKLSPMQRTVISILQHQEIGGK